MLKMNSELLIISLPKEKIKKRAYGTEPLKWELNKNTIL